MSQIEPIRKQIVINAAAEHAFRVFTDGFDRWWPREHHIGKAAMKRAVMEQRSGGRWYEIGDDGSECNWGRVLAWEPPHRLVLAWQITAQWQYEASFETEVEVTFTADGPQRTLVQLEHRQLERFGDGAAGVRKEMDPGWGVTLDAFGKTAAST